MSIILIMISAKDYQMFYFLMCVKMMSVGVLAVVVRWWW